jgi:hypothetical protein
MILARTLRPQPRPVWHGVASACTLRIVRARRGSAAAHSLQPLQLQPDAHSRTTGSRRARKNIVLPRLTDSGGEEDADAVATVAVLTAKPARS